jgi:hypothetical protein
MPTSERARSLAKEKRLKLLLAYVPVIVLLCMVIAVAVFQMRRGQAPGFGLRLVLEKTQSVDRATLIASNLSRLAEEFVATLTWPLVILAASGVAFSLARGDWRQRWLATGSIAGIVSIVLVSSFWGSRYFLFALPPLIISAVSGWQLLLKPIQGPGKLAVASLVLVPCVIYLGYQSALRIFDPVAARWSRADWGYIGEWTSGYGYPELAAYLQHSNPPPMIYTMEVGTAMQLRAYLPAEWTARVQPLQIVQNNYLSPEEGRAYLLAQASAWLVTPFAADTDDSFTAAHLQRLAGFRKPSSTVKVTLYKVIP